jgi:DNA-binding CsgD family transcriptional regulator
MTALRGYVALSDSLELRGRSAEAIIAAEQGILLARQLGYHRSMGTFLTGNMVESMIHVGRWEDARDIVDHTLASNPEGVFGATMLGVKSELAGMSGLYDAAEEAVRASQTLMGGQSEMQYDSPTAFVLADAARARGTGADALEFIRGALHPGKTDAWTARYDWPLVWLGTRIRADFRLEATGDDPITQATSELQARTPPARAWQRMTLAERLRADDANDDADADRRISAWQDAVEAWRAAGRPYELSYSLLRLAEAQAAAGLSVTSAVTEGSAIAAQLAARALSEAFVPLLPAAAKPAALPATLAGDPLAAYGVTPREREVLAMLAEGRSNPQIAEALFMSRKTASVHVSNILAKLGVANRVEAATFVSRLNGS